MPTHVSISVLHKSLTELPCSQATGLAAMEHSPSVILFEAVSNRAVELKSDFSSEQKTDLEKAFQKLGYDHDQISKKVE